MNSDVKEEENVEESLSSNILSNTHGGDNEDKLQDAMVLNTIRYILMHVLKRQHTQANTDVTLPSYKGAQHLQSP